MIQILYSVKNLLSRQDNDFTWSSWDNQQLAVETILEIIDELQRGRMPGLIKISVLFAPTGPLQEVSINSGWSSEFIKLADRFDRIKNKL